MYTPRLMFSCTVSNGCILLLPDGLVLQRAGNDRGLDTSFDTVEINL
jgi:hypothetical protein